MRVRKRTFGRRVSIAMRPGWNEAANCCRTSAAEWRRTLQRALNLEKAAASQVLVGR